MSAPEPSDGLLELVAGTQLVRLGITQIKAERRDEPHAPLDPTFHLEVSRADDEPKFRIKLGVDLTVEAGTLLVEADAEYEVPTDPAPGEALIVEYANHVGVMALLPFLRSALADTALRVFERPIMMPIYQRGEIWFDIGDRDPVSGGDAA